MLFQAGTVLYTIFICFSSILLNKTANQTLLIVTAVLFTASMLAGKNRLIDLAVQTILLAAFHWYTKLNWCYPLYMILLIRFSDKMVSRRRSVLIACMLAAVYTSIRLSYVPGTMYDFLVTGSDLLGFVLVSFVLHFLRRMENEKRKLHAEKEHLIKYDTLTGLINYQEFHSRLEGLLVQKNKLALFIIDCTDLKAMNIEQGFERGNELLKSASGTLRNLFADARLIARYGGDEFALILDLDKNRISDACETLSTVFPSAIGIQVSYGYSEYPKEGLQKDDLILIAEERLFSMKRDIWLKREEHMLRSEKLKVIGELAAGLAHEIRNPLTTLKGFVQMSKEKNYNIEPWFDVIMSEIMRVSELTAEFLQFSKPHIMNFRVHSLNDCVQRAINLLESESFMQGHQLIYRTEAATLMISMDKDKIVQLLVNLVKNAFEAMNEKGQVVLELSRENEHAKLLIRDTGAGIPESHLSKIFDPFFTTKENGTGLGLAICHKIVQDHRGKISVSSCRQGTTFELQFPLAKESASLVQK